MLVLSRARGEALQIGEDVFVHVLRINNREVRLGIDAPPEVRILRTELLRGPAEPPGPEPD